MKSTDFIVEAGTLPGTYIHRTSEANAELIKKNGFRDSMYGIFFNTEGSGYTGDGYGDGIIEVKFKLGIPAVKMLDTNDPNENDELRLVQYIKKYDLDDDWDEIFMDGDSLNKFCREFKYWAWMDDLQICVLKTDIIEIV